MVGAWPIATKSTEDKYASGQRDVTPKPKQTATGLHDKVAFRGLCKGASKRIIQQQPTITNTASLYSHLLAIQFSFLARGAATAVTCDARW
jgi:hypothetical protein